MFKTALTLISIAMQVGGLVMAAVGLSNTFRDVAAPGERFFATVLATVLGVVRRLWTGFKRLCRRLLGRPRPTVVHGLGAAMEINFAGSARGIVTFGPLPDPAQDADAFKAAVEERLNRVFTLAQDVQYDLGRETKAREQEDRKIGNDLEARLTARDEESKRATIRGLREQTIGFFFVAFGLVVQSYLDLAF
ncbi:hypothetical protein J8N05_35100 [Streptomyces sp. BH-SS-21]|uniref:Uncharacterized protein n=1 Tax=Streptomyces liliiviolaceus TaxID=2823109 RepID=A0A940Y0D6_9ACTN|nr:hypothetical protein [Streptomyces liliiviolaceus]MBQ0853396.1 hypothetical protein [Streptomyces liliiviolaceus]